MDHESLDLSYIEIFDEPTLDMVLARSLKPLEPSKRLVYSCEAVGRQQFEGLEDAGPAANELYHGHEEP